MKNTSISKQAVAVILSAVLLCLDTGCMVNKVRKLDSGKVAQPQQEHIVGVTTKTGEEIGFDPPGGTVDQNKIAGKVRQAPYSIALADVQRLWVERRETSVARTVGLTVAIAAAALITVVAIALATKQSCPFVYSWDGTQYVFDAEPYGGAITRGLERDDYSELEHLREQNGRYRLLLTNEVDETQFTNFMELWVVDHAPGTRIVADEHGKLYGLTGIQSLTAARDRYDNDLWPWLAATDRKIWEPDAIAGPDGSLRQEVVLTFPKPEGAGTASLIANAATGLWGSYMIKKIVELRGREAANWFASLDANPAAAQAVHTWAEREETYRLRVEVEEPTGWQVRGTLLGGGPLLSEDRVIPLDVSRAQGTRLRIRLRPPAGFWAFNSFAVAYGTGQAVNVTRVAAQSARTSEGKDVLPDLSASDDRYYQMPSNSDRAEISFPAPQRKAGIERTTFLHSRGWYQLHLRQSGAPDTEALTKIMLVPGEAGRFAAARFAEWRKGEIR
jgi:hypothetical protein